MKKSNIVMASIMVALSFTQVANAEDMDHSKMNGDSTTMEAQPKMMMNKMISNSEILSVLQTIDADEIAAANKAKDKKINKKVSDYAEMMLVHHISHVQKTKDFQSSMNAPYSSTPMVIKIHKENNDGLAKILKLDGKAFDRAYIELMMKGHAKALDILKRKLIPAAKDENLKKFLNETVVTVTSHLKMAQKIRKSI